MGQANDPADARKSPLPDNERADAGVPEDAKSANQKPGDGAGGDVELPPHPGENRPTPDAGFDESKADLVDQDATSRTFENPDGTMTIESSADVERVQDEDGDWHDVDLSLDSEGDRLETDNALVPVSVAKSAEDNQLGTMEDSSNSTITFNVPLKNAESDARVVNNESAVRYDDILRDGIDLTLQPVLRGIKSTYTVPDLEAADTPIYESLTLPEGWSARQGDGLIEIVDTHNVLRMTWSGGPSHDTASHLSNVMATMRLVGTVDHIVTGRVELPDGWARQEGRVFPLTIDPQHQFIGATTDPTWGMDTYVRDDLPSTPGSTSPPKLFVGKNSSGATFRSLMRFNAPAGNDVFVYDAYLRLSQVGGNACAANEVVAYRNTSGWSTNTTSSSQPTTSILDSSWFSDNGATCDGQDAIVDVTEMTQEWSDYGTTNPGGQPNYGLTLTALNESTTAGYHEFSSAEGASPPKLFVTFDRSPLPVSMTTPANGAKVGSLTPILSASTTSDLDGDPVQYNFRLATGEDAESGLVYDSDWQDPVGGAVSWQVPSGLLTDGQTYYWHVYAYDGPKNGSDAYAVYSDPGAARKFEVDLRLGDGAVTPMDSVGPVSVNLATGNMFTSTALRSANTASGALGLSLSYNSHATSNRGLLGQYYDDDGDGIFRDQNLMLTRRDPTVNFWWGDGGPNPTVGIDSDYFLVRWTGYITVPFTGNYYFGGRHDDGMRITIADGDGSAPETMLDKWTSARVDSLDWSSAAKHLDVGVPNRITVDLREIEGGAGIGLTVQDPNGKQQVVPASWLSSTPSALPQGWSLSSDVDGALSYLSAKDQGTSVVFTGADGSTSEFKLTSGGYVAPPDDTGMLIRDGEGGLSLRAGDGQTYNFNPDGSLKAVSSTFDEAAPASLQYTYGDIGGWLGTKRLTKVKDPVSGRYLSLTYNTGLASTCPAPISGLAPAPLGMLD